ncbi:U3 small nucleolar RNA-associated protein 18 homolog [Palaemon carinicauda]|uniref:U3 small nucleolar RNA-associated protein 18 homolog n=1 Tax=Palaemon carinicauda TaxID=392227 RepID=UPI0035B6005E
MVAKVPKVRGTMKKLPLMRVTTKTSLKKKNKITSIPNEASFKITKKKMKKLKKKKAAAESTSEKAVKSKLKGKKSKVLKKKPKMENDSSSLLANEEIISKDKERESNIEIKPGESEANKVDSISAEQCVIHQLPNFSTDSVKKVDKKTDESSEENPKKKKMKKTSPKKKSNIEDGSVSQSTCKGDTETTLDSTLQGNLSLNSDELEESAAVKLKQGKKLLGFKTKKKNTEGLGERIKKKKKSIKSKKKKQVTDDSEKNKDSGSEANVKTAFEDLPALSFVIDTEKEEKVDDEQKVPIKYTTVDALVEDKQKQRERELTDDLFGGMKIDEQVDSEDDEDEDCMLPSEREDESRKRDREESNIPDDPFDIHEMEVSLAKKKKPAWVDEEDENIRVKDVVSNMVRSRGKRGEKEISEKKYESELREKFSNVIGGTPDWADLDKIPKDLDEDDMGKKTGNYLSGKSSLDLPRKILEYKQMCDLNSSHSEGALIKAIEFNQDLQVAIVAGSVGPLGAVSMFQVDGNNNHRIHSVRFPNYPITCARFLKDGKRFVVGSQMHSHFFVYDMETSKETRLYVNKKCDKSVDKNLYVNPDGETFIYLDNKGKMFVYDTETLSLIEVMESPFPITAATFNSDGTRLYTYGLTGEVCVWDMTSRVCIHKFVDEGCITGDAIALSPNNQYLACGSRSGIVNIYDSSMLSTIEPAPVKVLTNLTTRVTDLRFNSTSEVLAMASDRKPNAVKLVHFPSMTVFENFPNLRKEMKNIVSVNFSPNSGYLALGNNRGAASLFRLIHFPSY